MIEHIVEYNTLGLADLDIDDSNPCPLTDDKDMDSKQDDSPKLSRKEEESSPQLITTTDLENEERSELNDGRRASEMHKSG